VSRARGAAVVVGGGGEADREAQESRSRPSASADEPREDEERLGVRAQAGDGRARLASPRRRLAPSPLSFTHDVFTRAMLRSAQVKVLNRGALRAARKNAAVFQAARTLATKAAAPTAVPSALPRAANLRANASESRTLFYVALASDSSCLHPPERPRARERAPRVGPRKALRARRARSIPNLGLARSRGHAHRGRALESVQGEFMVLIPSLPRAISPLVRHCRQEPGRQGQAGHWCRRRCASFPSLARPAAVLSRACTTCLDLVHGQLFGTGGDSALTPTRLNTCRSSSTRRTSRPS
jgi:hypothetical protein